MTFRQLARSIAILGVLSGGSAVSSQPAMAKSPRPLTDKDNTVLSTTLSTTDLNRAAQRHRTVYRTQQCRRDPLHIRIVAVGHVIRYQLRGRQYVAEIVVDLGDRCSEGCEAGAFFEGGTYCVLHGIELSLRVT